MAAMTRSQRLQQWLAQLSKTEKAFLIALLLRVVYPLLDAATGVQLPGSTLIRAGFIIIAILFLIRSFPALIRRVLWRVRRRLLVMWILLGVVPIVLICALVGEGLYILMGQIVGYMTTTEIARQSELVRSTADALDWSLAHREPSVSIPALAEPFVRETSEMRHTEVAAIVRTAKDVVVVPSTSPIREIPEWSKPGFVGLVKTNQRYYFGAHVILGNATAQTDVFLLQYAPPGFFTNLLPSVATVAPGRRGARTGGINNTTSDKPRSGFSFNSGRREAQDPDLQQPPAPAGRGWWDIPVGWFLLMPSVDLATGKDDESSLAIVVSRPSLIVSKLFSSLGSAAWIAVVLVVLTAGVLLIVEITSLLFGAKLTRSITRAVADLYEGTQKVQAGDFSHRIAIRSKDQLSELAGSFNAMTERIEHLIVEAKEKERLENELAIARDVQSQLFPKEFPRLRTLEMWGVCQPARTVSGDYYDFVTLGPDRAALAIGDISGKGISAALLMAHVQSALRFRLAAMNGLVSPSSIISMLNDHLYASSAPEKYATFFLGFYTDEGGELQYTNAGHLAPMLVRRGQVLRLAGEGFPVGMFPGIRYDQQAMTLEPGDLLVGFTDGVTETPNRDDEEFGDQRLSQLLMRLAEKPLDRIASEISDAVAAWTGNLERHDDTTLVLARRL